MGRLDDNSKFIEEVINHTKEEERKEREAWDKATLYEKIDTLKKEIDDLNERHCTLLERVEEMHYELKNYIIHLGREVFNNNSRVVSTDSFLCRVLDGELHNAVILTLADGNVVIRCDAEFCKCKYGLRERF